MSKEWYTAKQLAGMANFPKTPQAINAKAKKEHWLTRKRKGVQGKSIEYHINAFPEEVKTALAARELQAHYPSENRHYAPEQTWALLYHTMNYHDRDSIIRFTLRHGINALMEKIEERSPP